MSRITMNRPKAVLEGLRLETPPLAPTIYRRMPKPTPQLERAPASVPYNVVDEEPNVEMAISIMRERDAAIPHSNWTLRYTLEGIAQSPMNRKQRDYTVAVLRHIATVIAGNMTYEGTTPHQRAVYLAQQARIEAKAALNHYFQFVKYLAETRDPDYAASVLGIKGRQVRQMLKAKRLELPETV